MGLCALPIFERARGGVGNHFELHALQLGWHRPIFGIAFDYHFLVHLRAHKTEWSRAVESRQRTSAEANGSHFEPSVSGHWASPQASLSTPTDVPNEIGRAHV